jgi:hypothetical protein
MLAFHKVTTRPGEVYSVRTGTYISDTDPAYLSWLNLQGGSEIQETLDEATALERHYEHFSGKKRQEKIISDRQFFQALALQGKISEAEAEAAVATGVIPAAMDAVVQSLPANQRFAAKMNLKGATQFHNKHAMVAAFAQSQGMTDADVDALWDFASTL